MGTLFSFLRKVKRAFTPVDDKDEVWLLDNIAYPNPEHSSSSQWKAEYVVAFFKENEDIRARIGSTIASILQTLHIAPGDQATEDRIRERVAPFLRQIGTNMEVDVSYEGNPGATLHIGPSEDNGIFSKDLDVPMGSSSSGFSPGSSKIMRVAHQETESPTEGSATAKLEMGHTLLAADFPSSFGVISDIDDTIKITEVLDRLKLLRHTFIDVPSAVPGMAPFYRKLHEVVSTPASPSPFVYLSASPYNLYPFLREFVRGAGFPDGMIILRDMSWMDMGSFITSLTVGTQEYKEDRMVGSPPTPFGSIPDISIEKGGPMAPSHYMGLHR